MDIIKDKEWMKESSQRILGFTSKAIHHLTNENNARIQEFYNSGYKRVLTDGEWLTVSDPKAQTAARDHSKYLSIQIECLEYFSIELYKEKQNLLGKLIKELESLSICPVHTDTSFYQLEIGKSFNSDVFKHQIVFVLEGSVAISQTKEPITILDKHAIALISAHEKINIQALDNEVDTSTQFIIINIEDYFVRQYSSLEYEVDENYK